MQIMIPSSGSIRPFVYLSFPFFLSSSFFSSTFTFISSNSTFPCPLPLSFSTVFSFSFFFSAMVLLDAKAVVHFKINLRASVISRMSERRGFWKGIQPGYLVHGASSHHFLCPCLDPSASDISRFPTAIFKRIEAEANGFVFLCLR
jgi:hypothetical protein